jgi:hypothetical protein
MKIFLTTFLKTTPTSKRHSADIYLADPAVPGLAGRDHSVEVGAGAVVHVVPVPLQVQKVLAVVAPVRLKLNEKGKVTHRVKF